MSFDLEQERYGVVNWPNQDGCPGAIGYWNDVNALVVLGLPSVDTDKTDAYLVLQIQGGNPMTVIKGREYVVYFRAWNSNDASGRSGDSANFTLRVAKDGGAAGAPTNAGSITEPDSTNLPGVYAITLTASEMDGNCIVFGGISSTSATVVESQIIFTERDLLADMSAVINGNMAVSGSDNEVLTFTDDNSETITHTYDDSAKTRTVS